MEIDYKKLKDLGLPNDGKKKQFCPECHKERKHHPKDKSLSVDWERCIAHCHHCDASFFFGMHRLMERLKEDYPDALVVGHRELNPNKACPCFEV